MEEPTECASGKVCYPDEDTAIEALERLQSYYGNQDTLHPYKCTCGYWHLGHSERGMRSWLNRRAREDRRAALRAARRARPMLFLDVDGTLSPHGSGIGEGDVSGAEWAALYEGRVGDLAVPYRPKVVQRIQRLQRMGLIEVRWLTTWEPSLLSAWEAVGLGPFRSAKPVQNGRRRSWESNTVEQWMRANPDRRAIWVDDDLTRSRLRGFDRSRLLAIAPKPSYGLTDAHLARIEAWAHPREMLR